MKTGTIGLLIFVFIAFLPSSHILAAPLTESEIELQNKFMEQAKESFKTNDMEGASKFLLEVLKIGDHNKAMFNLGLCYEELKQIPEAIETFQSYLKKYPEAEDRGVVEELITDLRKLIPKLTIQSTPEGVTVYLDDKSSEPLGVTPLTIEITKGKHTVYGILEEYKELSQEFEADYGDKLIFNWNPVLEPLPTLTVQSDPPGVAVYLDGASEPLGVTPLSAEIKKGRHKIRGTLEEHHELFEEFEANYGDKIVFEWTPVVIETPISIKAVAGWGLVGIGAAALVVGIVFKVKSSNLEEEGLDCWENRDNYNCTSAIYSSLVSDSQDKEDISTYLFIGAGLGLAAGITFLLLDVFLQDEVEPESVSIFPYVEQDQVGLGFQFWF